MHATKRKTLVPSLWLATFALTLTLAAALLSVASASAEPVVGNSGQYYGGDLSISGGPDDIVRWTYLPWQVNTVSSMRLYATSPGTNSTGWVQVGYYQLDTGTLWAECGFYPRSVPGQGQWNGCSFTMSGGGAYTPFVSTSHTYGLTYHNRPYRGLGYSADWISGVGEAEELQCARLPVPFSAGGQFCTGYSGLPLVQHMLFYADSLASTGVQPDNFNFANRSIGAANFFPGGGTQHVYLNWGQLYVSQFHAIGTGTFYVSHLQVYINGGITETRMNQMGLGLYTNTSDRNDPNGPPDGSSGQPGLLGNNTVCNVFLNVLPPTGWYGCDIPATPVFGGDDYWLAADGWNATGVSSPQLSLEAYPDGGSCANSLIVNSSFDIPTRWPGFNECRNWSIPGLAAF
jgi:hypothetical protein